MSKLKEYKRIGKMFNRRVIRDIGDVGDYILSKIKGDTSSLYKPYIDSSDKKLKGLNYDNSIMFLCKSQCTITNLNIDEKRDMLVMIFPYVEVNDSNNDIISGFRLVFSINSVDNYNDITLSNEAELVLDNNNEIELDNDCLTVNCTYKENKNEYVAQLKIDFGSSSTDTFYAAFQIYTHDWNVHNRNDVFINLFSSTKCIYNKKNFDIKEQDDIAEEYDNVIFSYDLDKTLINNNDYDHEFYTLINYNNVETVQCFAIIRGYKKEIIQLYTTNLGSNYIDVKENSQFKYSNCQLIERKAIKINDKECLYIPFCSGFLYLTETIPVKYEIDDSVAGNNVFYDYKDLKQRLENLYYLNFTDTLCMPLIEQEFYDLNIIDNSKDTNTTEILYRDEGLNYYVYKTSDELNKLFPSYNKFNKVSYSDLQISNNYIPVFYYKYAGSGTYNLPVVLLFKNDGIYLKYLSYLQSNAFINKKINSIVLKVLSSDLLQYTDGETNYLKIDKTKENVIFQYPDIVDVNNFYYKIILQEILQDSDYENVALSKKDEEIIIDIGLYCLLKTPECKVSDFSEEVYISITEDNGYYRANDLDDLNLCLYDNEFINSETLIEILPIDSDHKKPYAKIDIDNIINAIESEKNLEFLIHFEFNKIKNDFFNKEYTGNGYCVLYVQKNDNDFTVKFNEKSISNLSVSLSKTKKRSGKNNLRESDSSINIKDSRDNIIMIIKEESVSFLKGSTIDDYLPCDAECPIIETDYNNYGSKLMALYKDTSIKSDTDNKYFSIFIGNTSIKLNDTTSESDNVYNEFKNSVDNFINSISAPGIIKLDSIEQCYQNEKVINVFVSIFIEYNYTYETTTTVSKHYFKRLLEYSPFLEKDNNKIICTSCSIIIINIENLSLSFEYFPSDIENFYIVSKETDENNNDIYIMDLNNSISFDTTEPVTIENKSIDYVEPENSNFNDTIYAYISNDGCNQYSVKCYDGNNYVNVPLDHIGKDELKEIKVRKAIVQCFPYASN